MLFEGGPAFKAPEVRSIARIRCDCRDVARPSGSRTEAAHGLGGTELEPRMVTFEPHATPLNELKCLGMDLL